MHENLELVLVLFDILELSKEIITWLKKMRKSDSALSKFPSFI